MRVALVCDWFLPRQGGIELHLRDLALALRARGIDAEIITTTPGERVVDSIPVHRMDRTMIPGVGVVADPRIVGDLRRLLERERFDIVHAHASVISPTAYGAAFSAVHLGIPVVITFHSMLLGSAVFLGGLESISGWSSSIMLTAVSSVVAAQLARHMPEASIGILPNGIDLDFWRGTPRPRARSAVHFVTAMRLTRKKRPERLLQSFARAVQFVAGSPELRLTIAGDGPDLDDLMHDANGYGIRGQVAFPGRLSRDELRTLYATADVFVLPSERESFGIAALEARAAGLPVIAMLATGARDFITNGVNGILAGDQHDLTTAVQRLASDRPRRDYLARANDASPEAFDWSAVASLHLAAYEFAGTTLSSAGRRSQA